MPREAIKCNIIKCIFNTGYVCRADDMFDCKYKPSIKKEVAPEVKASERVRITTIDKIPSTC